MRRTCLPIIALVVVAVLYGLTPLGRILMGTEYRRASAEVTQSQAIADEVDVETPYESVPNSSAKSNPASGLFGWLEAKSHPASPASHVSTPRSPRPPPTHSGF